MNQLTGLGTITEFFPEKFINWTSRPRSGLKLSRDISSFPGTVQEIVVRSQERPEKIECLCTFHDLGERKELLDFIHSRTGNLKKFWLKSQFVDFEMASDILLNDQNIKVVENSFAKAFRGHERVYLEKKDGTLLTYKIDSVNDTIDPGIVSLEIGAQINQNVLKKDVIKFGFLFLVRFEGSEFEENSITNFAGNINLGFIELVEEYPD